MIPERTPENRKIESLTPVLTTLTYDALNRLKAKTYNDNLQTPRVDYYYDSAGLGFAQKSPTSDLRLCRLPCGKPSAFRERAQILNRGYLPWRRTRQIASIEAKCGFAERHSLSARTAAKPQKSLADFLCKAGVQLVDRAVMRCHHL